MKRLLFLSLLAISYSGLSQNVPMYSVSPFDDLLRVEDTTSWSSTGYSLTLTSATGTVDGCNGLAVQPCTGTFYVVYKSGGSRYLGILDTATAVITEVGNMGDNVAGISFGAYDVMYAVTGDGATTPETLYEVDITTGAMTFKATLGAGDDGEAIAVCTDNGDIYHWSGIGGWMTGSNVFERIDAVTNAVTNITPSGFDFDEITGVVYNGNGEFILNSFGDFSLIDTNGVAVDLMGASDETLKGMVFPYRFAYFETNDSICPGDTAIITSLQGDSYEWFLDGVTTGITTQSIDAVDEGDYYCMVTIDTCTYPTNTVYLEVLNAPNVNLNPSPTAYLCAPGDSVLIHGPMGGSAQWYMNGSMLAGETNDSIWVFSTGGIYNMTKTNMNGCTDSAAVGTTVLAPPALMLNAPDGDTVCTGDNLLLVATSGGSYTWYMDGTAIAGETNDSIYVTAGGTYSVAAMFGDCSDSTATGITVVEEDCDAGIATSNVEIKMFPNPTSGLVNISLDAISGENIAIRVTGMDGRLHYSVSEALNKSNYEIDLSSLEAGNYIVHVSIDGTDYIQQIAKK